MKTRITKLVSVAAVMAILVGCTDSGQEKGETKAVAETQEFQQTIYYGGDIITMDGDEPQYVEAVVRREGKIAFVGSKADALKRFAENAEEVDLKGRTMLPSFLDPHGHFAFAVQMVDQVNLAIPPVGDVTGNSRCHQEFENFKQERSLAIRTGSLAGDMTRTA